MNPRAAPPASDPLRHEIGELRSQVGRLTAEIEAVRAHVATLEALALEDPLTGLLNRRGLLRELARAVAYKARYGAEVAVMMADLDDLKPINDKFGHEVGDRALAHVGDVLRNAVRASDTVGRIGGDEFMLILWQVDEAAARAKADMLQAAVGSSALADHPPTLTLGVSIGVTMLAPGDTPDTALARADRAMYARKTGRKTLGD